MKQGEREVTDYYMEMLALWQELDLSNEEEWRCSEDNALFKKRQEKERVFEFLAGLNRELDDVQGRILSRLPLPSTREVFAEVRREEARCKVMLKEVTATVPEGSALVSRGTYSGPNTGNKRDAPGVNIAESLAIPRIIVGRFMDLSKKGISCKPSDTPVEAGKRTKDIGKPEAVFKILRYLKGSPGKGLLFKPSEQKEVAIFTDADWAGSIEDRRSTKGYCTFVWGNLVTWKSKKQNVVARSSAEAKFRDVAQEICEGLWLRRILEELHAELELPINKRRETVDEKIKKLDAELARYKEQIKKTRPGPAQEAVKARAMRVLKQKRTYEGQRDMLYNQTFNLDQVEFASEGIKDAKQTPPQGAWFKGFQEELMSALKSANKKLKKNDEDSEDSRHCCNLQDEMRWTLMDVSNEIQESLGRSYDVPDHNLDALEVDVGMETKVISS
ncbi:unnamed protein product [Camellia sinensis]